MGCKEWDTSKTTGILDADEKIQASGLNSHSVLKEENRGGVEESILKHNPQLSVGELSITRQRPWFNQWIIGFRNAILFFVIFK